MPKLALPTNPGRPIVLSIVGRHNAGKTTVGEALVRCWQSMGYRVAVLKHEGHHAGEVSAPHPTAIADDWEKAGSDTRRYQEAGAALTVVSGRGSSLWRIADDPHADDATSLLERIEHFAAGSGQAVDILLVEGFSSSELPKLVVLRSIEDVSWFQGRNLAHVVAIIGPLDLLRLYGMGPQVYDETHIDKFALDVIASANGR